MVKVGRKMNAKRPSFVRRTTTTSAMFGKPLRKPRPIDIQGRASGATAPSEGTWRLVSIPTVFCDLRESVAG